MLTFYRYRLPFHKPFVTPGGTFTDREGVLLQLETDSFTGLSEASPLPGFSDESLDKTIQQLIDQKETLEALLSTPFTLTGLDNLLREIPLPASAKFALSSLGASTLLKSGLAARDELFAQPFRHQVKVNAVTGIGEYDDIISDIAAHHARGFRTVKIKSTPDPETLASALREAVKKYPSMTFRIDANQSWPVSDALSITGLFTDLNVEYIEEPISVESANDYRELVQKSPIPIALDESLSDMATLETALKALPGIVLIIKPTLLGNIFRISETISANRGPLHRVVVTTALESAVGRSMVQSMAAITGDPGLAHGLDTGRLFEKDLFPLREAENGILNLSSPFNPCTLADIDPNLIHKTD
ncbi:enolase C-terminal domain-like protein [Rhodohalobacter mucosus]|uniref:Mandelate racemase/muconate lactonizing enzyme C-terminal domain-containing protein n=1 Tax=Rhodohalobacter mucosus TaxID=2079485 RepID=A0A316TSV3_9BACT|nr:enolase C-terminal domain-like protein [Rhodohalobacter mucosus]PWN06948.1 hypothetical protein DDZ15_06650 [Rhodohalobacter mucosus]